LKLTNHISIRYVGVASLIVMLSIPVFYMVIHAVMLHSIDEDMRFQRQWIEQKLLTTLPENFVSYNNNITIRIGSSNETKERIFDQDVFIPEDKETITHRVLECTSVINDKPYNIRIQKSLIENNDLLNTIIVLQVVIFLLLQTALLFINRRLNRRIWIPFYHTLNELRNYRMDKQEPLTLKACKISELNDLNFSLNELTGRNYKVFIAQKEFTENAAHELQTPLAIMQSNLDLLMQTTPINDEQAHLIESLTVANHRISRLNKTLLLLAKIENNQFTEKEQIRLNEVITEYISLYQDAMLLKQIRVSTSCVKNAEIFADKTLVGILIGNLISNAVRHTPHGGFIHLYLQPGLFRIMNTSTGGALDSENLFKRFHKQGKDRHSVGLGLEICRKICSYYKYTIDYSFDDGLHCFKVLFK